jgi:gluconate kinase
MIVLETKPPSCKKVKLPLNSKTKPCLVACSVLKKEIKKLVENGELDANVVFVSKYFHEDFEKLETNLRRVIEHTLHNYDARIVLVLVTLV